MGAFLLPFANWICAKPVGSGLATNVAVLVVFFSNRALLPPLREDGTQDYAQIPDQVNRDVPPTDVVMAS
jgi:hypothetical protein